MDVPVFARAVDPFLNGRSRRRRRSIPGTCLPRRIVFAGSHMNATRGNDAKAQKNAKDESLDEMHAAKLTGNAANPAFI